MSGQLVLKKDPREIAYKIFDNMKYREENLISDHAPKKPDLFIQYGKDYIDQGGGLEFSCDYSRIRKISSWAEIKVFADRIKEKQL